ncbi:hypothetical protein [Actinokineospora iranica]|nr:hypothetical protein [Actinokineospora iranica]
MGGADQDSPLSGSALSTIEASVTSVGLRVSALVGKSATTALIAHAFLSNTDRTLGYPARRRFTRSRVVGRQAGVAGAVATMGLLGARRTGPPALAMTPGAVLRFDMCTRTAAKVASNAAVGLLHPDRQLPTVATSSLLVMAAVGLASSLEHRPGASVLLAARTLGVVAGARVVRRVRGSRPALIPFSTGSSEMIFIGPVVDFTSLTVAREGVLGTIGCVVAGFVWHQGRSAVPKEAVA